MKGEGTQFAWSTNGIVWNTIGRIHNMTVGGVTRNTVDEDPFLETPESGLERVDPSTKRIETYQIDLRWKPDQADSLNHSGAQNLLIDNESAYFRVIYPTDDNFGEIFHGFLTRWGDVESAPHQHVRVPITVTASGIYFLQSEDIDDVVPPSIITISSLAVPGYTITSIAEAQWTINGNPIVGQAGYGLVVPMSVSKGDVIAQVGSINSIEVVDEYVTDAEGDDLITLEDGQPVTMIA